MADRSLPLLLFFTNQTSGPARRMESLLAHLARKERARLRVSRIDVETSPELATRLGIEDVPALILVKDKRPVARLEGRVSAPQIERMLEPYLADAPPQPVAA
jgi:thioredoxin-like negative regulator of GroEL